MSASGLADAFATATATATAGASATTPALPATAAPALPATTPAPSATAAPAPSAAPPALPATPSASATAPPAAVASGTAATPSPAGSAAAAIAPPAAPTSPSSTQPPPAIGPATTPVAEGDAAPPLPPAPAPGQGDGAPGARPDRAPGPPAHAAAWQHASPPAHSASPLAGNVPLDAGQAPAPAPAAPAEPATPAQARPGVLLAHAAETLRLTISAANAQGISRARIALRPAELGGIEIALAHGPAGLSATLTADTVQAAQALQKAADELQRSLAAQGLQLASLEIGVAADGRPARGREDRGASADDHGTGHAAAGDAPDEPTAARTIELPNGVLVDVLA